MQIATSFLSRVDRPAGLPGKLRQCRPVNGQWGLGVSGGVTTLDATEAVVQEAISAELT